MPTAPRQSVGPGGGSMYVWEKEIWVDLLVDTKPVREDRARRELEWIIQQQRKCDELMDIHTAVKNCNLYDKVEYRRTPSVSIHYRIENEKIVISVWDELFDEVEKLWGDEVDIFYIAIRAYNYLDMKKAELQEFIEKAEKWKVKEQGEEVNEE